MPGNVGLWMDQQRKQPVKIYGNVGLAGRIASFQKKVEGHKEAQYVNPFSEWEEVPHRTKLDKDDSSCRIQAEESKTENQDSKADHGITQLRKQPVKIYGNTGLASRVSMFQKKAEEHKKKQMINPFSGWEGASHRARLDKDDPRYGKPVEGSKTEGRGIKANEMITNEIKFLCEMIWKNGEQNFDGTADITFGELFQIYTVISNKLVGVLMRARKHGLVYFEGEMLFQRRDDGVLISLLKPIDEINALFSHEA